MKLCRSEPLAGQPEENSITLDYITLFLYIYYDLGQRALAIV